MIKFISIFFTLVLISNSDLFSQTQNCNDKTINKRNLKFNGIYGLYDFVKPNKDVLYDFNSLTIKFDSLNSFFVSAGNGGRCNYYLGDSNRISFKNCMITLASIQCITKSGYKFSIDLFLDSLFVCNKFNLVNNEIRFFKDSVYKLALKPYYDLLPFPIRERLMEAFVREVGVETINVIKDFVVINSKLQMDSLGIILKGDFIDFEKNSLVIVENISVQKNKSKELKELSKFHKKNGDQPFFPVSYAKVNSDSLTGNVYLDIVNTYTREYRADSIRKGKYAGFIIDKIIGEKLKTNIMYTK
jgi:hypothetical protein